MTDYPFTPLIKELPATVPFVGPETQERHRGRPFKARLGANESVFGPSPNAIAAMETGAAEVWMYGDPENFELRDALAAHHRVGTENVTVGEGIDGLFHVVAQMFIEEGVPVVTSLGGYPTFNYQIAGQGGTLHTVPFAGDREDLEGLAAKAREVEARLVYVANPDNPMGTWWNASEVQAMIDALPEDCVLCLDEAYIDFAPEGTAPPLDATNPKVLRFRTFSKAYGMAGARIGYAIGEPGLIKAFDKVRNHFGVNRIAQAGALAALGDQAYLRDVVRQVAEGRERIAEIASANGLSALPSATNFVAIDCGGDDARAKAVLAGLIERDVFVRMPWVAPQNRCIRVSVGHPADLDLFADALAGVLKAL